MTATNASNPAFAHPHFRARRPLRERCSIRLTVQTSLKQSSRRPVAHCTNISQVTPPRTHPERTNFIHNDAPFDYLSHRYHLQELLQGLYVALADADQVDRLCLEAGVLFSHVLRIEPVENIATLGSRNEETMNDVCRAQKLTLKCPRQGRSNGCTTLSASQLLAGRDYLSLIMPYTSDSFPKIRTPSFNVKLLIVAPAGCAVDVISVVICYLAFSSGHHAETVMEYIEEEEYDEVWKEGFSREGLDFVDRIARIL
ncbi:hypothetical protein K503DRAFT_802752 [Rhizopogon vinicolor AM-OR11-026]|uniref:Uncharacterized protein n=1 Tax=Rhizopogon vinicolor AM-OR11-026 TaxID=1314800 RepID=A0A1B7MSD7_9AGAM|nr:hypothetical protein K503DRAFT_802752 [Rhizopogon vinicolor AM-OR11-026]